MKNILSFDIEDWYHANYAEVDSSGWDTYAERVQTPTRRILHLLQATGNTATFFVLGYIAERFPDLIREIVAEGHEVASHGYNHKLVYQLTQEEFIEDVQKSKALIEAMIGKPILGYRAPSWSISASKTPWALNCLRELGFVYDSSIFPFATFLYGDSTAHPYFHEIRLENGEKFYEVPPSILKLGTKRFPFSGGFYFRLLPLPVLSFAIKRLNRHTYPALLYLHPREIDPQQPRLQLTCRDHCIHYYNIRNTEKKLIALLKSFEFTSIANQYFQGF
jgi:polysaccharide deacetylase family protein (PEP-CTERM system associated)